MLDPYVYPGTEVLKNKFNTLDPNQLGDAEAISCHIAIQKGISPGKFDLPHLQQIHRELFNIVYPWAGEIRTVDISKGDTTFCRSDYIENEANKLFGKLAAKDNQLTHIKDKSVFVEKFADYYAEINVLHPFREGNGRATRIFFEQLAAHNGYKLDLSKFTKEQWLQASINSYNCDNTALENILDKALKPLELESSLKQMEAPVKTLLKVADKILASSQANLEKSALLKTRALAEHKAEPSKIATEVENKDVAPSYDLSHE